MFSPPSDEDFNLQLRNWAQTAQQAQPRSQERQVALNRMIQAIWHSNQLGHPQRGQWPADVYQDLYNEALQRTLLEICQKIEAYNPVHPVMAWVNFLLRCHFSDVVKDHRNWRIAPMSLEELEQWVASPEPEANITKEVEGLRDFLQEDPEGCMGIHVRKHPAVTFQWLALARSVEDRSWDDLAIELGISAQTLSSFFHRQLRKLTPYFHRYLY